jgi:hypothetical protein
VKAVRAARRAHHHGLKFKRRVGGRYRRADDATPIAVMKAFFRRAERCGANQIACGRRRQ